MADKTVDTAQKIKQSDDDKPDYQEKITFLVSTVAQGFILTWCLLVLSLGYVKLPNTNNTGGYQTLIIKQPLEIIASKPEVIKVDPTKTKP